MADYNVYGMFLIRGIAESTGGALPPWHGDFSRSECPRALPVVATGGSQGIFADGSPFSRAPDVNGRHWMSALRQLRRK